MVAHAEDQVHVVVDEQQGGPGGPDVADPLAQPHALRRVEAGGRLVEEQDRRLGHARPRDRHELALAGFEVDGDQVGGAVDEDDHAIPGGVDENFNPVASNPVWHFSFPAIGFEMATITDFHGVIAAGEVQGAAHGSDGSEWWFDCDMRFMEGKYVAVDGRLRDASFGFV